MLRRSLIRYMNLALILVLRSISSAVKQRFPTLEHVVEAGENELLPVLDNDGRPPPSSMMGHLFNAVSSSHAPAVSLSLSLAGRTEMLLAQEGGGGILEQDSVRKRREIYCLLQR